MSDRYTVAEAKVWRAPDGRLVSVYSSHVPKGSKLETTGFSVKDNRAGTVGTGRAPYPTHEAAQAECDRLNRKHERMIAEAKRLATIFDGNRQPIH